LIEKSLRIAQENQPQMATFKAIVPYIKNDGTARVMIRITHKKKEKVIPTDIYLLKGDKSNNHRVNKADKRFKPHRWATP
jgi:hypothetical protein